MGKKITNYEADEISAIYGVDGWDRDESMFYVSERGNTRTVKYDTG